MPVYDYKRNDCGKTYDVFHKVREVLDDVVCPSCESKKHTRLISAPNILAGGGAQPEPMQGCQAGDMCCGGACEVN